MSVVRMGRAGSGFRGTVTEKPTEVCELLLECGFESCPSFSLNRLLRLIGCLEFVNLLALCRSFPFPFLSAEDGSGIGGPYRSLPGINPELVGSRCWGRINFPAPPAAWNSAICVVSYNLKGLAVSEIDPCSKRESMSFCPVIFELARFTGGVEGGPSRIMDVEPCFNFRSLFGCWLRCFRRVYQPMRTRKRDDPLKAIVSLLALLTQESGGRLVFSLYLL